MPELRFTVLGKPQPQGSMKAFVVAGKARLTSDNAKLRSWRQDVGLAALHARPDGGLFAERHVPVSVHYLFVMAPPAKLPKGRTEPVVKPDASKLIRAAEDAMTGIIYHDDAQITLTTARKVYGLPARTVVVVRTEQEGMFRGAQ